MSPTDFKARLEEHIAEIRSDIRRGAYKFNKLRIALKKKPTGSYRVLAIPTVRDRLLQRALLADLEADRRVKATSTISYGFTKGRKLRDAQEAALMLRGTRPWVLKADIERFFDRIPRQKVKDLINEQVRRKSIARLLCSAVDCELDDGGGWASEIARANGIQKGRGLRQGMPVSPMLSNILLKEFDDAVSKRGIVAVRYADDIAVFGSGEKECLGALDFMRHDLGAIRLTLPPIGPETKTSLFGPSEAVEFLGVEIRRIGETYKLSAPFKKLEKIATDMASIASAAWCLEKRKNLGQVVRILDSFVIGHYHSMQVLDNPEDFLARLEAAKRKRLKCLLVEILGKHTVEHLNEKHLSILGLVPFT